ncbi:MAG: rhodanese-like domain-containing protein [Flavobacteriales bacterium]|nr:rhodanese-like domain-containing protein [Flavobacteriales bacterium]
METNNLPKALEICPTTTQQWVANGALLVDVRERDEVAEAAYDVPNIINIPLSEFEERFAEVPRDRDVVMVCRGGGRSLKATYYLMNHGYTRVVNMSKGILRWQEKGFPMKGNIPVQQSASSGCCGPTPAKASSCCDTPNSDGSACC